MLKQISALAIVGSLGACASLPDVTYTYYHAKSATAFAVTQNLQCVKKPGSSSTNPQYAKLDVTTSIATPATTYLADYDQDPVTLKVKKLDGFLSDTDANFTFVEDGRLGAMNVTLTGQGETILKSAISLGSAAFGFGGAAFERSLVHGRPPPPPKTVCDMIATWPGSDKLSLTFTRVLDLSTIARQSLDAARRGTEAPQTYDLNAMDPAISISDMPLYICITQGTCPDGNVKPQSLPVISVVIGGKGGIGLNRRVVEESPAHACDTSGETRNLCLQDTASVRMEYLIDGKPSYASTNTAVIPLTCDKSGLTDKALSDCLAAYHYRFAMPQSEPFGTSKASLALAPSGAVTTVDYNKTNGAAGAMNVATSAFTAATPAATTPPVSGSSGSPANPGSHTGPDSGPQTNPGGGSPGH
jgi:hypothetical protein